MSEQSKVPNRLINEKSPYLLQHAYNPVDWYPWGEEAFAKARQEDKPIFLSIGYSTCHWCHVMERESFENEEISRLMNETFINIKVDREELPDVDQQYMEFAQSMLSGDAGWPLNVLLTPMLKPFFAMTYLPPEPKHGMLGMEQFVNKIDDIWHSEEKMVMIEQADKIVEIFHYHRHKKGDSLPSASILSDALEEIYHRSDSTYGGNIGAPKFPIGYQTSFLIDYGMRNSDSRALFLAHKNLEMMHRGGIYDHLGGGFSRYSIDDKWLIPHFEKMLYDNALLLDSYIDGWLASGKVLYKEICKEIADYILREMTQKAGGFFCAEDSETLGSEGLYYTWNYHEIELLIHSDYKEFFLEFYNITPDGNFDGLNVLNTPVSFEEFCQEKKIDPQFTKKQFNDIRQLLLNVRYTRSKPFKDDKILTSWNGLMIHSLARVGTILNHPEYTEAAVKAAQFIKDNLWKDGILYRRWREGDTHFKGNLDDYALLTRALLTLHEMTASWEWLTWAIELTHLVNERFKDEHGILYQTEKDSEHLLLRKCQFSDGSEPSGVALHAENLLRLHEMTGDDEYLQSAEEIFKDVRSYLEGYPPGYVYHLRNLLRYEDANTTLVIIALAENDDPKTIAPGIFNKYRLHHNFVWLSPSQKKIFATLEGKEPIDGKTTFYVCRQGVCSLPSHEV